METEFKIVDTETPCFEILKDEATLLSRIKAKMGFVAAVRVLRMKFRNCQLIDARRFVESLPAPPETENRCVRCGSMVFSDRCSWEKCPFSEYSQTDKRGWKKPYCGLLHD